MHAGDRTIDGTGMPAPLERRRQALASAGELHRFHWMVVGLSLMITLVAWYVASGQNADKAEQHFDREADEALTQLRDHIRHYEDALWGGVAAVEANGGDMRRDEWAIFASTLQIGKKYPGINGIGIIHQVEPEALNGYLADQRETLPDYGIHPPHDQDIFFPISYIEPTAPNQAAVGLDMAHEANRLGGILRARDTGTAQVTGPIVLVQDEGRTPGFLFFAPWYTDDDSDDRAGSFVGAVYAPFVVKNLIDGALGGFDRQVSLRLTDNGEVMYDDALRDVVDIDPEPLFERRERLDLYGRTWEFDIASTVTFRETTSNREPIIILIGGIIIDSLLLGLFVVLTRSNRRALAYADDVTSELLRNGERLEASNAELEKFAYAASHDLKTPLRGIANLTEWLREDLGDYLGGASANPDVARNFDRVDNQLDRMNELIEGLLAYSRVSGPAEIGTDTIAIADLVSDLRLDFGLDEQQLGFSGEDQMDVPAALYLKQVVTNLVSNAVQHHDRLGEATITVTAQRTEDHLELTVSDDGPGIDPIHQQRIFEVFQTLGGSGTGIGLSVVRKIIDKQKGTIVLHSEPGVGTTFNVTWPLFASWHDPLRDADRQHEVLDSVGAS